MAIALELQADPWPDPQVDPYIRLAVALIETEPDENGVYVGIPDELDVLAELKEKDEKPDWFKVPPAYDGQKFVAGTVAVTGDKAALRKRVAELRERVDRLKLSVRQQPKLEKSLKGMGLRDVPRPSRRVAKIAAGKSRIVVGIIDDGCAFAHYNFLNIKSERPSCNVESRILSLWDQSEVKPAPSAPWTKPNGFDYGRVLTKQAIDQVLDRHLDPQTGELREDAVYKDVGYLIDVGSHGTHVMDIAAGNGNAGSWQGVAPNADIIFVQIPKTAMGNPEKSVLTGYLLDGIKYIFSEAGDKAAVVNISYGGYGGPHDGTSLFECAMDDLLKDANNRAIVISAGNAYDANCHASGDIDPAAKSKQLRWLVGEDDPTLNIMEIWYDGKSELELELTPPSAAAPLVVRLGRACSIRQKEKIVGWAFHRKIDPTNQDNHILIALRPSRSDATGEEVAPAPSGTWLVQLSNNKGRKQVTFDAWIERDDAGSRKLGKKLQSSFAPDDASPDCTLGSFATGRETIIVGGYNTETGEICSYSASGPTRDRERRRKPDVCAPAEEDAAGSGILSATSLSSQPTAMNGTSAAAPHVTGLVALLLESQPEGKHLRAREIRDLIVKGASGPASLKPNSRSEARKQLKTNGRSEATHPPKTNRRSEPADPAKPNSSSVSSGESLGRRTGAGRISADKVVKKVP
jgi:subtilisin family serine protease